MTTPELIERAKRQLHNPDLEIDLAACVMQAKSAVAQTVMRDPMRRSLLIQEYPVTLDATGRGDLLTAVGSVTNNAGEILIGGIWAVLDADGVKLHPLLHYHDFIAPQNTAFGYYNLKDTGAILTRAIGQQVFTLTDIQSANGPITVTASYEPEDVDDFPSELEPDLVQALCNIVRPANATA